MKKITFFDVVKLLPMDEANRKELINNYPTYTEAKKFEISTVIWASYNEYEKQLFNLKYGQLLEEVSAGKRNLSADLFNIAKQKVWQDFDDILSGKTQEVEQIEDIRTKLHDLIQTQKNQN